MKNKKVIIMICLITVVLIAAVVIWKVTDNSKKEDNGDNAIAESNNKNASNNVANEQNSSEKDSSDELIVDTIEIDDVTYEIGKITLKDLEKNDFHIDYDNATLYLDEEKNEMYQGVDGQHPELLLTEDRKDAKYMMKPDGYNSLKYKIANDKYSGMKFHGDLFDYQYCPMVLNIQNWSSDKEKDYKECDVTSITFGVNSADAFKDEDETLNRLQDYPNITINGIGLLSDESDVLKTFGEPTNINDLSMKTLQYYNKNQSIDIQIHDGKVYKIEVSLMKSFYK